MPLRKTSTRFGILSILVLGFFVRLLIAWQGVETLVQKTMPDDAFYYFVIVRNIALGKGITFDGLRPTNGFHPLWALVLIPVYLIFKSDVHLPLHLSLSLAAALDILTAWLGYRTVRAVARREKAALVTAFLYVMNPVVIMESINGLETALRTFCFAWTSYYYLVRIRNKKTLSGRDYLCLGGLIGLMGLARTDNVFLCGVIVLDMLRRRGLLSLTLPLASAFVVVLPWLAWNQITFGTIMQSSGLALPYINKWYFFEALRRGLSLSHAFKHYYLNPVLKYALIMFWRYSGVGWTLLIVLLGCLRIVHPRFREPFNYREMGSFLKLLAIPLIATLISLSFHTFYRFYPRSWYHVPLAFAVSLLVGPVFALVGEAMRAISQKARFFEGLLLLGAALIFLAQARKEWTIGFNPMQVHMYRSAAWIDAETAPDDIIGSFNAGIQAYLSHRTVVNLDGVTNWEALEALRQQRLLAYIRQSGIDYVIDFDFFINDQNVPFWGEDHHKSLKKVATLSGPSLPYGEMQVYQVQ